MSEDKMNGMLTIAYSVNGYPYKQVGDEWVPDDAARTDQLKREAAERKAKGDLIMACRSRILTPDEMGRVAEQGINLFIEMNGGMSWSYNTLDLEKRLGELLLQQFRIQSAASSASSTPTP